MQPTTDNDPRSWRGETSKEPSSDHDFGVADKRGRAIGARILRSIETFVPAPPDARSWTRLEPGTYFVWTNRILREGQSWGPGQETRYCATAEEGKVRVAKFLRDAEKRARKTYGPKASSSGDAAEVRP